MGKWISTLTVTIFRYKFDPKIPFRLLERRFCCDKIRVSVLYLASCHRTKNRPFHVRLSFGTQPYLLCVTIINWPKQNKKQKQKPNETPSNDSMDGSIATESIAEQFV